MNVDNILPLPITTSKLDGIWFVTCIFGMGMLTPLVIRASVLLEKKNPNLPLFKFFHSLELPQEFKRCRGIARAFF